jgi:hypothetical protein
MILKHSEINNIRLRSKIRRKLICLGGNIKLKIYGTLHCKSGKRMIVDNRVFFQSEKEAIEMDFRPCGHCMKTAYKKWIFNKLFREENKKGITNFK